MHNVVDTVFDSFNYQLFILQLIHTRCTSDTAAHRHNYKYDYHYQSDVTKRVAYEKLAGNIDKNS